MGPNGGRGDSSLFTEVSGSHKLQREYENSKFSHLFISTNQLGTSENSTDLTFELGRCAPRSKSDELSDAPSISIEILSFLSLKQLKRFCTFWDPESSCYLKLWEIQLT